MILPFNPVSEEYKCVGLVSITPETASYILKNHNKDNRKLNKGQVNKICNSIHKDGWLQDGGTLTFNKEGNITEFQHRLHGIVTTGVTAQVPVILGVEVDAFTKGATARPRKPEDEIQRKDKTALDSEVTTLRQLVRRRGSPAITLQNAIAYWEEWKDVVREGTRMVDHFFDATDSFNSYQRVFCAWSSLMKFHGQEDLVEGFLDLLESEVLDNDISTPLMKSFLSFFKEHSWEMSNGGRVELMYELLCHASDRYKKEPSGRIELGLTNPNQISKHKGFYNLFLEDPQGLLKSTL